MNPNLLNLFRESPYRDDTPWPTPGVGGGSRTEFYVLIEDMQSGHGGSAYANLYDWSRNEVGIDKIYNWGNPKNGGPGVLDGAKSGYWGLAISHRGNLTHLAGPCVDDYRCPSNGALSATPTSGIVGEAYSYTVVGSNINDDIAISGLPSGLSVNATTGAITGTPTESGRFGITITATSDMTVGEGTCTITLFRYLEIAEA